MNKWEKAGAILATSTALATGLLVSLEGYSSDPYIDVAGVLTDCYGNTHNVDPNQRRTKEECDLLLNMEAGRIGQMLLIDYPDHTVNSLASGISFVYNIGDGAYKRSTYRQKLLRGDHIGACHEMSKWVYITSNGQKVKSRGLENRRKQEVELCLDTEILQR
ncbi:MAG: lysozyme [Bacteroides sp.]